MVANLFCLVHPWPLPCNVAGIVAKVMGEIYKNTGEVPSPQDMEDEMVKE